MPVVRGVVGLTLLLSSDVVLVETVLPGNPGVLSTDSTVSSDLGPQGITGESGKLVVTGGTGLALVSVCALFLFTGQPPWVYAES